MNYECHGHLMMDGNDYAAAKRKHIPQPDEAIIRKELKALQDAGITYFREGGDDIGVLKRAREIASEYGIEYVTPAFAIHKKGFYGWIVGRGFADMTEYRERIEEVKKEGGEFVKIIVSGIITFKKYGELSCDSRTPDEIRQMIHIAHDEGFAVMIHVNSAEAIRACVENGADSIEHGYFADDETLCCIAEHDTIWVPTLSAVDAFIGREGFDEGVARETLARQMENVRFVHDRRMSKMAHSMHDGKMSKKADFTHDRQQMENEQSENRKKVQIIACGSDSGAVGVPHGPGTWREYQLLAEAGISKKDADAASEAIRIRFKPSPAAQAHPHQ